MPSRTRNKFLSHDLRVKLKSAKGRKLTSTRWLERQLNDPYVKAAKQAGYRSRSAFKLLEINEKYNLIKQGDYVLDLGAAPGGWSQIAVKITSSDNDTPRANASNDSRVIAIDINHFDAIVGVKQLQLDFLDGDAEERICRLIGDNKVDVVLSDMASPATGHKATDHNRIMALCEVALEFSLKILNDNGNFCCKVLKGGTENSLLNSMKCNFKTVKHVKPNASRADSSESYVVALGFKGGG